MEVKDILQVNVTLIAGAFIFLSLARCRKCGYEYNQSERLDRYCSDDCGAVATDILPIRSILALISIEDLLVYLMKRV